MRVSYRTLFHDANTIYLVERQCTQIRGLLLFLGITPKMRDDEKTGPSPLFEYEKRAISALPCSRLRHVAYPFPVARWHVTLDVKHDPGQRCSRVCTGPTVVVKREITSRDDINPHYWPRFFSFAHSSRYCVFPFLREGKSFQL